MITGDDCTIEHMNRYIDQGISVDMNSNPDPQEEAALREHAPELPDKLNSWSPADCRPNSKYRRELHLSFKRTVDGFEATLFFDETRVKPPSIFERLARLISSFF